MKGKRIFLSVTSDVVNDQRIIRTAHSLMKSGAFVRVVGRYRKTRSEQTGLPFEIIRMRLLFNSGPLFYIFFNLRIFFFLLFRKADILVANDLDTLLPNYLLSILKRKPLVYDSHELFTYVPELQDRRIIRWIWTRIEKLIFPGLRYVYTVSPSIARLYNEKYGVNVEVIRNVPFRWKQRGQSSFSPPDRSSGKKMIILQGTGINVDRGAEEAVEAMIHLRDSVLFIIGCGDVIMKLKRKTVDLELEDKVRFIDRLPYQELMEYTSGADLGLSLDKGTNLNYQYSLPNKLFDYIQAGIPVLASNLPEVGSIIKTYGIGDLIESHDPQHIAKKIEEMLNAHSRRIEWKTNLSIAAEELCWEKEEKKLIAIYEKLGLEF